jgi:hypothetical protein
MFLGGSIFVTYYLLGAGAVEKQALQKRNSRFQIFRDTPLRA